MTQTAVSELVKRAEQAGLVKRNTSPTDGRVSVLALTPAGEQQLLESFIALRDERRQLFEAVNRLGSSFRTLMHSHDEVAP
jgi:DNA-binding MarR family transcriptional regulator